MQFSSKSKIRIATGLAVLLSKWRFTTRYFRYLVFRILPGDKAYYHWRDIRIAVEVNSEWEFERLTSEERSFERYPLDQCLENGLSSESSVYYELGLPPPTHISIDTEGAELSVLKGMTDVLSGRYSTVEVVVVELLGVSSPTSHLITDFMDQYSYEIKNYVSSPVGVVEHCIVTFGKKTREK